MPTAVEAVERYLETDVALHQALSRGLLNIRRAARWLIETQSLNMSEEAVVSAIRRYRASPTTTIEEGLELLAACEITARTGLTVVMTTVRTDSYILIRQLGQIVRPQETLQFIHQYRSITIVAEAIHLPVLSEILGSEGVDQAWPSVGEVRLDFPERLSEGSAIPAAIAIATNALGRRGTELLAHVGSRRAYSIFVPDTDTARAYDLLASFRTPNGRD